mmetsp:Transcript_23914/g.47566  ORF Transcript_23914/g.47566 Transcript_23914/m.47566 type:complete len:423 (+) Transcript_23914:72-1340(+)
MSNLSSVPSSIYERSNIEQHVRVHLEANSNRTWIVDPATGNSIDINTPLRAISMMRMAALHRAAKRYEFNEIYRGPRVSIRDGIVFSPCGSSVSAVELQRMDNEDLQFRDMISLDFPLEDPITFGGASATIVESVPDNLPPTEEEIADMDSAERIRIRMGDSDSDSDDGLTNDEFLQQGSEGRGRGSGGRGRGRGGRGRVRGGRSGRGRGGRGSEIRGRSSEIEGRGGGDPGQRGRGRGRDGRRYLVARRSIADTRAPLPSIPVDVDADDEEDDIPPAAFTRSPPSLLNNLNLFVDVAMGLSDDPVTVSPGSLSGGGGNGGDSTDGAPDDTDPTEGTAYDDNENMTKDTAPGLSGIENAAPRPGGANALRSVNAIVDTNTTEATTVGAATTLTAAANVGAATGQGGNIMLPKFFDNAEGIKK